MHLIFSLFFFLFLQVEIDHTYKTECVNLNQDGTILLKIWDTKKGKNYKETLASIDAVQSVLFDGFTGKPCDYIPPLLFTKDQIIEFEELNLYFFKKSGDYADYVISSKESKTIPAKMKDKNAVVYEVMVNKTKLDQYLVDEKIKNKVDQDF